jgi:splicing factor 3A subunit 1
VLHAHLPAALFLQIDWHDFVIVETIDFYEDEDEELPPPMSIKELVAFNKQQALQGGGAAAAAAAAAEEAEAMEADEDAEQVGKVSGLEMCMCWYLQLQ